MEYEKLHYCLQVFGHGIERRSILLTADVDGDLRLWFMEINKALIMSRPGNFVKHF